MLEKYNIAMNDKGAKVKLLQKLLKDYKLQKEQVFKDIQGSQPLINRIYNYWSVRWE